MFPDDPAELETSALRAIKPAAAAMTPTWPDDWTGAISNLSQIVGPTIATKIAKCVGRDVFNDLTAKLEGYLFGKKK